MTRRFTPLADAPLAPLALPGHAERAIHDRPRPHPQAGAPGAAGGSPGRRAGGGEHDPRLLLPRPDAAPRAALLRGDGEARRALLGPDPVAERGGRRHGRARGDRARTRSATSATVSTCAASIPRASRPRPAAAPARRSGSRRTRPVVGFVGRLVAEKGVPELLEAARVVRERHPRVRFLVVGAADEEKADQIPAAAAARLDDAGVCVFAGFRHDMPELYRSMDVFALPSHREGFPRAPMEASAMKVPCVVTDVRGCRQAVTHGRNGLLVPVGDARALAEAILSVLGDPLLARRLGEEGRRRAVAEFDEQRVFETVLVRVRAPARGEGAALARAARGRERRAWTSRARSRGDEHAAPEDLPFAAAPRARGAAPRGGGVRLQLDRAARAARGRVRARVRRGGRARATRRRSRSGTAALHLALRAARASGPATRSCAPRSPSSASANPIVYEGAAPVFVDSERGQLEHGPGAARATSWTGPPGAAGCRERSSLVDLYGQSADLDADPRGLRPPRRSRGRGRGRGAGRHLPRDAPPARFGDARRLLLQRQQDHHHLRRRHARLAPTRARSSRRASSPRRRATRRRTTSTRRSATTTG